MVVIPSLLIAELGGPLRHPRPRVRALLLRSRLVSPKSSRHTHPGLMQRTGRFTSFFLESDCSPTLKM
jgi:hypothetical protein